MSEVGAPPPEGAEVTILPPGMDQRVDRPASRYAFESTTCENEGTVAVVG